MLPVANKPRPAAARPSTRARWALTSLTLSALVSACGGGGGGETPVPVTPPVVVVKTTLSGTAATGAAMAGATVRVKCVAGAATATATASGAYTLELSDATLPCVVSATSSDGATVLHSLANPAGGATQTININPLTELLVARVASGTTPTTPASFYSGFGAATAGGVTAASITSATTSVVAMLKAGGVDFSAVGNPITAPLVAASGGTAGNAYDQALDALGAKLRTAGTTVAQLATQVAAAAAPATPGTSTVVGLPAALLLQPASPTCAALRSGSYRLIDPVESEAEGFAPLVQINATTGVLTFPNAGTASFTSTGNCTYKLDDSALRMVVSQGGVMVITSATNDGRQTMAIAFPEQPAVVADMAGTWNVLEFNNIQDQTNNPLWINDFTQAVFAADGSHQSLVECFGLSPCTPIAGPHGTIRVNATGGLDYVNADGNVSRLFIYRPASGDPMLVMVKPNQEFYLASKNRRVAARALGETWGTWTLGMTSNGSAAATFADVDYRASAVDAATQSYTRQTVSDGNAQVFTVNKPRDGLIYRAAGTSTLTNGQLAGFNELIVMPLPGTGMSVYATVTTQNTRNRGEFGFAISKP